MACQLRAPALWRRWSCTMLHWISLSDGTMSQHLVEWWTPWRDFTKWIPILASEIIVESIVIFGLVLGNSLAFCAEIFAFTKTYYNDDGVRQRADQLAKCAELKRSEISSREYRDAQAAVKLAKMDWDGARQIWTDIADDNPTDFQALKLGLYMSLLTGQKQHQFDLISKAHPHCQRPSVLFNEWVLWCNVYWLIDCMPD